MKVLIVEDNSDLREILGLLLSDVGYHVTEAESGNSAYEMFLENEFDIIVSDIRMPNGTGIELLDKVYDSGKKVPPVVLMTGFSDLKVDEAYTIGSSKILSKPWENKVFLDVLKRLLMEPKNRWSTGDSPKGSLKKITIKENFQLGRGGVFVEAKGHFPLVNECVEFIIYENGKESFSGVGCIEWVRPMEEKGLPSGYGFLFKEIQTPLISEVLKRIESVPLRIIIPNRIG